MKKVILLSVSILLISLGYSFAEVPCKINYQGRLIENNVPVDGTKTMVFSIYNRAEGGTLRWTSEDVSVEVHNGLFRYVLGEGVVEDNPVDDLSSIPWTAGETLYLEVKVEADILTPREAIYAYPYAINSHLLEGKTTDYFLNTTGEIQTKQGNLKIEGILDINAPDTDIDALRVHSGDTYGLYVSTGGNVGIGTTNPDEKLHVDGNVEASGLVGCGFIDRGNAADYDGRSGDFIRDGNWHDWDLSSVVPSGAKAVALLIVAQGSTAKRWICFRKKGSSGQNFAQIRIQVPNILICNDIIVACDENQKIEYAIQDTSLDINRVVIKAWWK